MRSTRSGFAQILILIGILVVALATGAYYFGNLKSKPLLSPFASPGSTENWKTYTNEKYSYSIKYPSNYSNPFDATVGDYLSLIFINASKPEENRDNRIIIGVSNRTLIKEAEFHSKPKEGMENFILVEKRDVLGDGTKLIIRTKFTLKATAVEPESKEDYTVMLYRFNNYTYFVGVDTDIADQILSTFKFLK